MVLVSVPKLLIPKNMKFAVQSRNPTTAPILIPAPTPIRLGRFPMASVMRAPYESGPTNMAQTNGDSRATPVAEPAFIAYR
jgi:hypothetical protein